MTFRPIKELVNVMTSISVTLPPPSDASTIVNNLLNTNGAFAHSEARLILSPAQEVVTVEFPSAKQEQMPGYLSALNQSLMGIFPNPPHPEVVLLDDII